MSEDTKQCIKCGEWKPLDTFRKGRNQCKVCVREYKHEHYQQHRESVLERAHEYRQQNKASIVKYKREYQQRKKVDIAKKKRRYYRENKESINKSQREYYQRNKEAFVEYYQRNKAVIAERHREWNRSTEGKNIMYIHNHKRRARKHSLPDTFTVDEWKYCLSYFNGCCAVCGRQLNDMFNEFRAAMDHWIPITYGGLNPGTVATNIVPLCHGTGGCNNSKYNIMPGEWLISKFGKRKARQIASRIQAYFDSINEKDNDE